MTRTVLAEILDTARPVALGLVAATLIQTVAWQPFTIPSASMEPGLQVGDYIVTSKFAYGWSRASLPFNPPVGEGRLFARTARRGDVVVFRLPRDPKQTWIKRVIGLPGDTVQLRGGVVWLNGRPLPQTSTGMAADPDAPQGVVRTVEERQADGRAYVLHDRGPDYPGDDTGVFVVPGGHYLMMGDNRDNSLDSRWPADVGVGLLPAENIIGRAELIVASWKPGAGLFKPWTWFNLRGGRFFRPVN